MNASSAAIQDSNYATASVTIGFLSQFLSCSGYNFSGIPSNATITGLTHTELQETTGSADCQDSTFILTINASSSTDHGTVNPWFTQSQSYGSSNDLWGLAMTPANVSSIISKHSIKKSGGSGGCTAGIDSTGETVFYAVPSSVTTTIYNGTIRNGTLR